MKKIFVLVGKSCAGKDTLISFISEKLDIPVIVSSTNRPAREGEIQGKHYNFLTKKEMLELYMSNKLVAHTLYKVFNDGKEDVWHYGVNKNDLEKHDYALLILNPEGVEELKRTYGDNKICSILITSSAKNRLERCIRREDATDEKVKEYCRRFLADEKDFKNFNADYILNNNRGYLLNSYFELAKIILHEVMKCN